MFLTLLKHTNTIICLQIFKKHAKLTYLFIWKTMLQSVILLCVPGQNVGLCFGLWNPPTASLPNCISAPRVTSWRETPGISFQSSSYALDLVGVINLATCACLWVWGGGAGWKKPSTIIWFWAVIPSSTTVNSTYSTFKGIVHLKMYLLYTHPHIVLNLNDCGRQKSEDLYCSLISNSKDPIQKLPNIFLKLESFNPNVLHLCGKLSWPSSAEHNKISTTQQKPAAT